MSKDYYCIKIFMSVQCLDSQDNIKQLLFYVEVL
nr:MAG TPA: hypothetical protein [Caudoviricetes sp.]